MPAASIELNDSEIRVARDSEILLRMPGYAVLRPDAVLVGSEAQRLAHLNPREASNRFWVNLNQDALAMRSSLARHNADLAYRQLLAIHEQAGKPDAFVFSVPGSYSTDQLSLLLGIVEACPFNAAGLVDTAVAGAAAVAASGDYVHLDIHLHQTVLTALNVDDQVHRGQVQVIDDCGITDIHDTCAALIADLFIQQSRFDPLHHAETEQSLYDQIPGCLARLNEQSEVGLEIRYDQAKHQVRLSREPLLEALEKHYGRILAALDGRAPVLLGDRLGALPGLQARLPEARLLAPETVFQGIEMNRDQVQSAGPPLSFITSLPASPNPSVAAGRVQPAPPAEAGTAASAVTHVLLGHRALPLGPEPLYLSANGDSGPARQAQSHCSLRREGERVLVRQEGELSLYINGRRSNGEAAVQAGDTLGFAGSDTTFRFIQVLEG